MIMNSLQNWLSAQLDERGWSAREAARRAGVSHTVITEIMNSNRLPTYDTCFKLADLFHVDPRKVISLAGLRNFRDEKADDSMLAMFDQLTHEDQERVLLFMRAIIERDNAQGQ